MLFNISIAQRFELLDPSETAVDFVNQIEDTKDHNILIYSNYYGGAGVGVGDFNQDGLQDLFFAGNLVDDKLYYNKGAFQFEDGTLNSGINAQDGWSSGVVVADFNQDGWLDIYVTRELYDEDADKRRNKLYINQGRVENEFGVKFKESAKSYGLDSDQRTRHAGVIDYNMDGLLDILLLNQPPNPGNYSAYQGTNLFKEEWAPRLMKNTGNGRFVDVTKQAGLLIPCYPNSMAITDYNKDGLVDIYISNDYEAPDFLYENQGNGRFKEVLKDKLNHISYYAMGVDIADINNDLWPDIMTLDMVAEDNFRSKSNMSGMDVKSFEKIVNQGGHYQYMYNAVHLNNQGESFSDIAQITGMSSTDWSWSNLLADFDNDGLKDVYITNGLLRDIRNTDADKNFAKYVQKFIKKYLAENPNQGDIQLLDILPLQEALNILPSVKLENYTYRNKGNLAFEKIGDSWGLSEVSFSNGSAYADLDNDGDLDIIVNNINDPAFIYRNNTREFNDGKSNFIQVEFQAKNAISLIGSTVELEMKSGTTQLYQLNPVRGMYSSSQLIAHFGVGSETEIRSLKLVLPNGDAYPIRGVKINQKHSFQLPELYDQVRSNVESNTIFKKEPLEYFRHEENNFDDYEKQVLLPHRMSTLGPATAVGDINQDGLEDVFIGGSAGFEAKLFTQTVSGSFVEDTNNDFSNSLEQEDINAIFLDIDGDEDLDLYVVSGGNEYPPQSIFYQDQVYLNSNGLFTLDEDVLPKFRESGSVVKPFDMDQDGDLDLFVGGRLQPWSYPSPTSSRILENQGGKYIDVTSKKARDLGLIGMVTDAEWTDFDRDGDIDILLVGEWMSIILLENDGSKFVKKNVLDHALGWWNSISVIDVDNDGKQEYLLGNLGLNYKYKATKDEPFEVHYGDFDENGSKDIVLSYYNFGEQFPLRGRSCSSQQVPQVAEAFPTYNEFASSKLIDVYSQSALEEALHYKAETFASAILKQDDTGEWLFEKLPNYLQLSSINDIYVEDFDQDGFSDILVTGNNYYSEIETPRNDAGISYYVKNIAGKSWEVIPSNVSGIMSDGNVKNIIKINGKEGRYMFVVNNDMFDIYTFNKQNKKLIIRE